MEDVRQARSGSIDNNQTRLKNAKQSLSPFRNGVLAHNDNPSILRSNSEKGHGRIKVENSRLSFRPNGESSPIATQSPHTNGDIGGMQALAESPDEDAPPQSFYKTPSILDEDEDDPESHAAMTRRAEEILANAKKRLNVSFTLRETNSCINPKSEHGGQSKSRAQHHWLKTFFVNVILY